MKEYVLWAILKKHREEKMNMKFICKCGTDHMPTIESKNANQDKLSDEWYNSNWYNADNQSIWCKKCKTDYGICWKHGLHENIDFHEGSNEGCLVCHPKKPVDYSEDLGL